MHQSLLRTLFLLLLFVSCRQNSLDINTDNIQVPETRVRRLDQDLFTLNPENLTAATKTLQAEYGSFFDYYIASFLNRGGSRDSLYPPRVLSFLSDRDIRACQKMVQAYYTAQTLSPLVSELNDCVKRFKYHFPGRRLPSRFVTCLSGWNFAAGYSDSTLVTGLDMYLGDTCIFYQMLQLPQYRTRFMNERYILPDLMRAWVITEFDDKAPVNNLLHHTVFYGKIYYAVNALLPEIQDSVLLAYTAPQMKYCHEYEKKLWGYFAEKNRLYENNLRQVQELTVEGPFTASISRECPPRIAMWVGLQIVRSYMKNNETDLAQLMAEKDAQKILAKSRYRP
jgi:hypothetical protein